MTPKRKKSQKKTPEIIRNDLVGRLRARRTEIEKAIVMRIQQLSDPVGDEDAAYAAGLHSAVAAALTYGLDGIEMGRARCAPIPPETAKQARRAARDGVRLDIVLRRYASGNRSLEEFIVAEADGVSSRAVCQILSDLGSRVDVLMDSVAAEYRDELEQIKCSSAQKEADRIVHLLRSSNVVGPADFNYDFDPWHVGMILVGYNAEKSARAITGLSGYKSLLVARDHEVTWVWLGSAKRPVCSTLESLLEGMPKEMSVAIGEPRKGLGGWRQTHHEAQMALQVMLYRPKRVTRCRDVILTAAVMRDQSFAMSLIQTYLAPLDGRGDSGEVLRTTLRAYFKANQNTASAALALGVARHTVERRLQSVEKKLGQTLDTCRAQLQVALSAEELSILPI